MCQTICSSQKKKINRDVARSDHRMLNFIEMKVTVNNDDICYTRCTERQTSLNFYYFKSHLFKVQWYLALGLLFVYICVCVYVCKHIHIHTHKYFEYYRSAAFQCKKKKKLNNQHFKRELVFGHLTFLWFSALLVKNHHHQYQRTINF
uniref:Uncharacterized protein n=1 Tax=Octopus bimaculoides TaxID=37653 RepID=A0A0L8I1J4_OCTBM